MATFIIIRHARRKKNGFLTFYAKKNTFKKGSALKERFGEKIRIVHGYLQRVKETAKYLADGGGFIHAPQHLSTLDVTFTQEHDELFSSLKTGTNLQKGLIVLSRELNHWSRNIIGFIESHKQEDETYLIVANEPIISAVMYFLSKADISSEEFSKNFFKEKNISLLEGLVIDHEDDEFEFRYLTDGDNEPRFSLITHEVSLSKYFDMGWLNHFNELKKLKTKNKK